MNIKNAFLVALAIAAFVAAIVVGFVPKRAEPIYWMYHRTAHQSR